MMEKLDALVRAVAGIARVDAADVMSACRRSPLPACRWMVGEALMQQGYSCSAAARLLGIDHATLLHGVKLLHGCRRYGWYPEADIYDEFLQLIGGGGPASAGSNPAPSQIVDCHV